MAVGLTNDLSLRETQSPAEASAGTTPFTDVRARGAAGRMAERTCFALLGLTVAFRLLATAGGPSFLFEWTAWIAAIAAVVGAFLPARETRWLDPPRAVLVLTFLILFPSVYTRIGGDGCEYYALLRSAVIDGDMDFRNDFAGLGYRAIVSASGQPVSRVQIGLGLFWLPLFAIVHVVAGVASRLGASVSTDGFSELYQSSATFSSFVYGGLAVLALERTLRRWFTPGLSVVTVLAIWLATPLYFYTVANPFMSHAVSVFATTLFMLAWLRARKDGRATAWAWLGLAGGMMMLVRAPSGALLLLPVASLCGTWSGRSSRLIAYLAPPALLGAVQLLVWRLLHGPEFVGAVSGMNLIQNLHPHFLEMLISPRHGLFVWTPLYLAAALGWLTWLRRDSRLALFLIGGFILTTFVNSLFDDWWGSDAFGQRRLLGLTPFYALGLAGTLEYFRRRPLVMMSGALTLLVVWNFQLAYIYNSELIGPKGGPINLDRLAVAQVDTSYRRLLRWSERLPPAVWTALYDIVKGVWLDEGPRSLQSRIDLGVNEAPDDLPMLIGEGWFEPERGDGIVFRATRGPRSRLLIPIRTVGDFDAVLHARLELGQVPVDLELKVNGVPVGQERLRPGWQEYRFLVSRERLRSGLNAFVLAYSATPRQALPGFDGRNTVLVVDYLSLNRRDETASR
jgi:hypothetical protein